MSINSEKKNTKKSTKKATTKPETAGNLALNEEAATTSVKPAPNKATINALLNSGLDMEGVKFCIVPIDMLEVDHAYQRPATEKVRAIADHWDYAKAGALNVSLRDGRLYVMDGQHRMEGCLKSGRDVIMCAIREGQTMNEEIDVFVTQNENISRVSKYDIFHARWHKGDDQTACELKALLDKYHIMYENPNAGKKFGGTKISRTPGVSAPGRLGAMGYVMQVADIGNIDLLKGVFEIIRRVNWHSLKNAYSEVVVFGLVQVLRGRDAELVSEYVCRAICNDTPDSMIFKARSEFDKVGPKAAVAAYLEKIVNHVKF